MLAEDEIEALEVVEELMPHLSGTEHEPTAKRISAMINGYDFEGALATLAELDGVVHVA